MTTTNPYFSLAADRLGAVLRTASDLGAFSSGEVETLARLLRSASSYFSADAKSASEVAEASYLFELASEVIEAAKPRREAETKAARKEREARASARAEAAAMIEDSWAEADRKAREEVETETAADLDYATKLLARGRAAIEVFRASGSVVYPRPSGDSETLRAILVEVESLDDSGFGYLSETIAEELRLLAREASALVDRASAPTAVAVAYLDARKKDAETRGPDEEPSLGDYIGGGAAARIEEAEAEDRVRFEEDRDLWSGYLGAGALPGRSEPLFAEVSVSDPKVSREEARGLAILYGGEEGRIFLGVEYYVDGADNPRAGKGFSVTLRYAEGITVEEAKADAEALLNDRIDLSEDYLLSLGFSDDIPPEGEDRDPRPKASEPTEIEALAVAFRLAIANGTIKRGPVERLAESTRNAGLGLARGVERSPASERLLAFAAALFAETSRLDPSPSNPKES